MTTCKVCAAFLAASLLFAKANAAGLEMTIRGHANEVVFGDPLYVEVTIVNRGDAVATARCLSHYLGTFRYEIYDVDRQLIFRPPGGGGLGGCDPVTYEPGKPVIHYWNTFVPGLLWLNHPFWQPNRTERQAYLISAVYTLDKSGQELRSKWIDLAVEPRPDDELRHLDRWTWADPRGFQNVPLPSSFGLHLRGVQNPRQTRQFASQIQPGEIADLLTLTLKLQDLYAAPPEMRDVGTRDLVQWLKEQPDIKRQALTKAAHSSASSHRLLLPSVPALESLLKDGSK
ncbi:MAG: hypothetical protein WD872_05315 [Pirellulaceae bacterium]